MTKCIILCPLSLYLSYKNQPPSHSGHSIFSSKPPPSADQRPFPSCSSSLLRMPSSSASSCGACFILNLFLLRSLFNSVPSYCKEFWQCYNIYFCTPYIFSSCSLWLVRRSLSLRIVYFATPSPLHHWSMRKFAPFNWAVKGVWRDIFHCRWEAQKGVNLLSVFNRFIIASCLTSQIKLSPNPQPTRVIQ